MTSFWFGPSLRYCYRCLLLAVSLLAFSAIAQTTNPAYLADMPSVDRVKVQIQGTDATDTAARQVAVFTYLQQYVQRMKNNRTVRGPYTPDEQRVLTAYSTAAYQIQQDYNKSHTPDEAKKFDNVQYNYMLNNGDEWSRKLIGPQSAAAYTSTLNQMNARQQAHVDSINKANEEAKANAAKAAAASDDYSKDPTVMATRRCLELGGTPGGCTAHGMENGLMSLIGADQVINEADSMKPGPYLSGGYSGSGNGSLGFTLSAAYIGCGKLAQDSHSYTFHRTGSGVQVVVNSVPSNITLVLRPDGSLVGPGTVQVDGRVITGYSSSTTTLVHQDGSEAWGCAGAYGSCRTTSSSPIYAPASAHCTFATLAPPAPSHQKTGAAADDGSFAGGLLGFMTSVVNVADPGIRMNGKFVSSTGLLLDFEGDALTMDCGMAHAKVPYTVQNAPGEFRIAVDNPGAPFTLKLIEGNSTLALEGTGRTTVNGRLISSQRGEQIAFRQVPAACNVDSFPLKSASDYKALIANPPIPSGASSSSSPAASFTPATSSGGPAIRVLIDSSFPSGSNPAAGQWAFIARQRHDDIVRQLGVPLPPNASPAQAIQASAAACQKSDCTELKKRLPSFFVTGVRLDAAGKGTLTAPLAPGLYYIFVTARPPGAPSWVWDIPATLHAGDNGVTLQASNGEQVP